MAACWGVRWRRLQKRPRVDVDVVRVEQTLDRRRVQLKLGEFLESDQRFPPEARAVTGFDACESVRAAELKKLPSTGSARLSVR